MFPHQGGQGQLPTHWQPPTSQQPANGAYAPAHSHMNPSLPPPPPQDPRPDMAQHPQHPQHPQYQQPYRLPGPNEWNRAPPPPDAYRQQPPPPPQYVQQHHQPPAPRQRTAIACRYCRRRKIRCSGFEATEDGRCTNCLRFNQDCIFTPVSAQTQAFVPAHTVWRGVGQPPPMYGAYGQPLPPAGHAEAYGQPPRQQQQQQQQQQHQQYLPSPTAGPYTVHSEYGHPGVPQVEASHEALNSRKRPHPEPHTPTLPPPAPGAASQASHRGTGQDYAFPPQPSLTANAPTANPPTPYSSGPPPNQPYYAAQPPRQGSPQSAYRYEPSQASSSPRSQAPTTPGAPPTPYYNAPPQQNGVLQPPPPRSEGRTPPPPTSQSSTRPGMRINDLVSDNGGGRSSTDAGMLNMLNRRPM